MMNRFTTIVLALCVAATGCGSEVLDVDISQFSRLPALAELDYSRVTPAESHDYWELRWTFSGGDGNRILGAGGLRPRTELAPDIVAALDSALPPSGFFAGCLPGHCYTFISAVNGTVEVLTSRQQLLQFLGPVGSVEEAALIAHSYNLHWAGNDPVTGYREVRDGWEILALQLVRACAPVQTDRVHVLVRRNGTLLELGREVHSRSENACV
jgi:hypothetical protein